MLLQCRYEASAGDFCPANYGQTQYQKRTDTLSDFLHDFQRRHTREGTDSDNRNAVRPEVPETIVTVAWRENTGPQTAVAADLGWQT